MTNTILEILIPTFNREQFIIKNLKLLESQISSLPDPTQVGIIISDNHSEDDTVNAVSKFIQNSSVKIKLLQEDSNKGLERNVVKVLSAATSPWVMFLGDDDYLPMGYISFVINKISISNIGCIVPGFTALYSDGKTQVIRGKRLKIFAYKPGFKTVLELSQFGHQLSGLTFSRDKRMIDNYINSEYRNIYPFIYFIAFNMQQKNSIYAPKFQVLVSQNNSKDWKYDSSGLVTEIYLNYILLFKNQGIKTVASCLTFTHQQQWRIRPTNFPPSLKVFNEIRKSKEIPYYFKICFFIYFMFFCYIPSPFYGAARYIKNRFFH